MRHKGFSLIELLVTLTFIAILALSSIGSFSYFVRKNEQQMILDELRTAVQFARIQAVNLESTLSLSPLDTSQDWAKGVVLRQLNHKTKIPELLYKWQWSHPHWVIEWSGIGSSHNIILANNPGNSISNGHFTLTNNQTKKQVILVLNRLGRVRIKD